MLTNREDALARVTQQLSKLEKRDWELWAIISVTGVLVSAALLAILFRAAFLKNDSIHFELTVSRPLAIGLFVLLALLNTYLVAKRFEVRRLREQFISTTLQGQVIEQQSFTDPLTEIYNRAFPGSDRGPVHKPRTQAQGPDILDGRRRSVQTGKHPFWAFDR